jgi:hypothetical protein
MNFSTAIVEIIKGTANPAEYTAKSVTPVVSEALDAAMARILARIGPIHGVQPAPKPIPITNEPTWPAIGLFEK